MKIKNKTSKSAKKRFLINNNNIIKYKHSNTKHLLSKKSKKRKRNLRKISVVSKKNKKIILQLISKH